MYCSWDYWDVLRLSGRACDGSKRTIKIWNVESATACCSQPAPCRLGVLSFRCVRLFRRLYPSAGPILFAYLPTRLPYGLHILEDSDIVFNDWHEKEPRLASLGVTCDLLLSSKPVFVSSAAGIELDQIKAGLVSKVSKLGEVPAPAGMVSLFYASNKLSTGHWRYLDSEMFRLSSSRPPSSEVPSGPGICRSVSVCLQHNSELTSDLDNYDKVYFFETSAPHHSLGYSDEVSYRPISDHCSAALFIDEEHKIRVQSPFSSNSSGYYTYILDDSGRRQECYVKSGPGVEEEFAMLPTLSKHFPPSMLQRVWAYDAVHGRLVFERFPGRTVSEMRLALMTGQDKTTMNTRLAVTDCLINIELIRAQRIVDMQLATIRPWHPSTDRQSVQHFYFDRLAGNSRIRQLYGSLGVPQFLRLKGLEHMLLENFMSLKLVVNGAQYPSLQWHCARAEAILSPSGEHMRRCSVALGLGDCHGGNVMVHRDDPEQLLFIDYEAAGFHSPFLDLAKSLYNDAFFSVFYRDLLAANCGVSDGASWSILDDAIHIRLDLQLSLLERVLGFTKLKYVLQPIIAHLRKDSRSELELGREVLAAALFSCATLTRDFSEHPVAFFMNSALGVILMENLEDSLNKFFGWTDTSASHTPHEHTEDKSGYSSPLSDALQLFHHKEKVGDTFLDGAHRSSMFEAIAKAYIASSSFIYPSKLEPEMVFLRRPEDTLQLHRRFSEKGSESSAIVLSRIARARKLGMEVSISTFPSASSVSKKITDRTTHVHSREYIRGTAN